MRAQAAVPHVLVVRFLDHNKTRLGCRREARRLIARIRHLTVHALHLRL